ncbi:MAG: hypothetical protein KJ077_05850 [Anaerolineae bacterium]|nr:hypothetical protein [Anaerolineae bacterium]
MSLRDVLTANLDLFLALYVFLLICLGLALHGLTDFYRSKLRLSFKVAVSLLILTACLYLSIFSAAMYFILADTSFISHIQAGDLIPHLKKGGL